MSISVIIPIYNVEKYLNKCLDSICNQTIKDYEIILVNDGSTDKSGLICEEWKKKDSRIRYYTKENEGLGPTRYFGMERSSYDYVTFVDSDDWVSDNFVESMYHRIKSTNADIVYCDCCYVDEMTDYIFIDRFRKNLNSVNASLSCRLSFGYPNVWAAIYNKKVWIDNHIEMPGIVYEDTAAYGILLNYAKKIEYCEEPLYYYRTNRPGSLMQQGSKTYKNMLTALDYLLSHSVDLYSFKEEKDAYLDFCIKQLQSDWMKILKQGTKESKEQFLYAIDDFLNKYFNNWRERVLDKIFAIGSYTSSAVYNKIKPFRALNDGKFQYVSMVNFLPGKKDLSKFEIIPSSRQFCISMFNKEFNDFSYDILKDRELIIIDLLDERFDLLEINGVYYNNSDAFMKTFSSPSEVRVIDRYSDECLQLWKKGVDTLFGFAHDHGIPVFVLKLKYNYYILDDLELVKYDNEVKIQKMNDLLDIYYKYIEEKWPDTVMLELPQVLCNTQKGFVYGERPEHFSNFAYFYLGYLVTKKMRQLRISK